MLKWLRKIIVTVLALLVLAVLAVQVLRWTAYGDKERAAVALASAPPPPAQGSNGYAAIALSDFDIPADALDAEIAAEVRDYTQWLETQGGVLIDASRDAVGSDNAITVETWTPRVGERYPERAALTYQSPMCSLNGAGCLELARKDTGTLREFMQGQAARLAMVDQALAADHLRSLYPSSYQAPSPPLGALRLSLTQAALDAVDGRVPEAMTRTCRTLAGARRFNADARDLLGKMVFPALAQGAAALLLELRLEHPDVALPADCAPALQPVQAGDFQICEALRGEFRMGAAMSALQDKALADRWAPHALFARWVLMDGQLQDAWMAQGLAESCTDAYQTDVLAGIVPPPPARAVSRGDIHCYAAVINCVQAEITLPAYGNYQGRLLDSAAKLRVLMAAHAAVGTEAEATAIQAAAGSPGYAVQADPIARTLAVTLRFPAAQADPDFIVNF